MSSTGDFDLHFFSKKCEAFFGRNIVFHQKLKFLIQKITKQDKETVDKRNKEVPESDKTVCWETELVRGYEAQERVVVPESFAHLRT